jgi:ArsR family transcriptional regulator
MPVLLIISIFIDIMRLMKSDEVKFAKALADETRQEIMRLLCCEWLSVNDVVDQMEGRVNQPTVSHHLRKLEESGLASVRRKGRQRLYTLNQDRVAECCNLLIVRFAPDYSDKAAAK